MTGKRTSSYIFLSALGRLVFVTITVKHDTALRAVKSQYSGRHGVMQHHMDEVTSITITVLGPAAEKKSLPFQCNQVSKNYSTVSKSQHDYLFLKVGDLKLARNNTSADKE